MTRTVVLLTASWCPRCPPARLFWDRMRKRYPLDYRELDIDSPEGEELAARHAINAVPAVVVSGKALGEVTNEAQVLQALEASSGESQPTEFA